MLSSHESVCLVKKVFKGITNGGEGLMLLTKGFQNGIYILGRWPMPTWSKYSAEGEQTQTRTHQL